MLKLFVSYARNEEGFVSPLRLILKQSGYDVWRDRDSINPGEEWAKEIRSAVAESDVLLLCCSQASMQSDWVNREVDLAIEHNLKIIPLLVEKAPLMDQVSHLHWIDFTAIGYYEQEYNKLIRVLEAYRAHLERETHSASARVFLSYQHGTPTDEQLAVALESALDEAGYDVFLDDQVIMMGTKGAERVLEAIRDSDFYIVLLSEDSVTSEVVALEVARAHEWSLKRGLKILPVRVGLRKDFPYRLRATLDSIPWVFWQDERDTPTLLHDLIRALEGGDLPLTTVSQKATILTDELDDEDSGVIPSPRPFADPEPEIMQLEHPTGTVNPESRFYIARACDDVVRQHLETVTQGATVVVKAPRQMGKSSLLMQGISYARNAGKSIAYMDFQMLDNALLEDENRFYKGFCQWIVSQLKLKDRVESVNDFWDGITMANPMLCTEYMSEEILPALDESHLVLAMDEVDRVFVSEFSAGFFGMLRSWHNNRSFDPIWRRLDLVMIISTEPYLLIDNPHQSPFNVGELATLDDFTLAQVMELNRRHKNPLTGVEVEQLMAVVNGHPYLTREAMYQVAMKRLTLADIFTQTMRNSSPFADHMMHYMFLLNDYPELEEEYLRVINGGALTKDYLTRLQGAGLVTLTVDGASPRCKLYADYFGQHLRR